MNVIFDYLIPGSLSQTFSDLEIGWRHYRSTMWSLARSTAPISILGWFLCCNVLREKLPQTDHTTHTINTIASLLAGTNSPPKKIAETRFQNYIWKKNNSKNLELENSINLIKKIIHSTLPKFDLDSSPSQSQNLPKIGEPTPFQQTFYAPKNRQLFPHPQS